VTPYKGTKSIVISTVSWIGGKNPFLGWAYVGASALFILLGIAATIRHVVKPRSVSDAASGLCMFADHLIWLQASG
jgi:hypothetical protein